MEKWAALAACTCGYGSYLQAVCVPPRAPCTGHDPRMSSAGTRLASKVREATRSAAAKPPVLVSLAASRA